MTNLFAKPEWTAEAGDAPDGWIVSYRNGKDVPPLIDVEWKRPNVDVAGGVVRLSLNNSALWADVTQMVNVIAGATYRMMVEVQPTLSHNGSPAADPISGELRVIYHAQSAWIDRASMPDGAWQPIQVTFTPAVTGPIQCGWEVRLRHPLSNNIIHLRKPVLELLSPPPGGGDGVPGNPPNPPAPDPLAILTNIVTAITLQINLTTSLITGLESGVGLVANQIERDVLLVRIRALRLALAGLQADVGAAQDEITRLRSLG